MIPQALILKEFPTLLKENNQRTSANKMNKNMKNIKKALIVSAIRLVR